MKKLYLIIVLLFIFSACNKQEDNGVSSYEKKDYINAFIIAQAPGIGTIFIPFCIHL